MSLTIKNNTDATSVGVEGDDLNMSTPLLSSIDPPLHSETCNNKQFTVVNNYPDKPNVGLDDVDGAMFSRVPSNLHSVHSHSANLGINELKKANTAADPTTEGLDEADGALFSRIPFDLNSLPSTDIYKRKTTKEQQNSDTSNNGLDDVDCAMFSRVPSNLGVASSRGAFDVVDTAMFTRTQSLRKAASGNGYDQRVKSLSQLSHDAPPSKLTIQRQCMFSRSTPQIESPTDDSKIRSTFYLPVEQSNDIKSDIDPDEIPQELVDESKFEDLDENTQLIANQSNERNQSEPALSRSSSLKSNGAPKQEVSIRNSRAEILKRDRSSSKVSNSGAFTPSRGGSLTDKGLATGNVPIEIVPSLTGTHTNEERVPQEVFSIEDKVPSEKKFEPKHLKSIIVPCLSIILFLTDIGTDIQLARTYRLDGRIDLFYITLVCIVVPSIIMAIVDLSWIWIDRERSRLKTKYKVLRIIVGCLSLGRIVRAIIHIHHVLKSKRGTDKSYHKGRALEEKRDCFMLDFINAFAESCPQLFVQLYLFHKFNLPFTFFRATSLLSSWISIAWTYAAYYRCHREASKGTNDVKLVGFVCFFFSVLSALAARVSCIALFFVYFRHWIGSVVLLVHLAGMLVWIIYQKPELKGLTSSILGRVLYYLFFAYVSVICFVNLRQEPAKIRMRVFYLIVYIENCTLAGLTLWKIITVDEGLNKEWNLLMLPIGGILHVVLLIIYYKLFHPKTGRCY